MKQAAAVNFRPRRAVSFSCTTRVKLVPSLYEMSDAEVNDLYYSPDDAEVFQSDILQTVRHMRRITSTKAGAKQLGEDVCIRGLEYLRSTRHLEERTYLKSAVVDAVLGEQERQRQIALLLLARDDSFVRSEEAIANASRSKSCVSTNLAITLAAADESFVRRTIEIDRRQKLLGKTQTLSRVPNNEVSKNFSAVFSSTAKTKNRDDIESQPKIAKSARRSSSKISHILRDFSLPDHKQSSIGTKQVPTNKTRNAQTLAPSSSSSSS